MEKAVDYYKVLEVAENASRQEILLAYEEKVNAFRWLLNTTDKKQKARIQLLQKAHDTLLNPREKERYDQLRCEANHKRINYYTSNLKPEILRFCVSQNTIGNATNFKLEWKTKGADQIILKPFGSVLPEGEKLIEKEIYETLYSSIELLAYNTVNGESISLPLSLLQQIEVATDSKKNRFVKGDSFYNSTHNISKRGKQNNDYQNQIVYKQTTKSLYEWVIRKVKDLKRQFCQSALCKK